MDDRKEAIRRALEKKPTRQQLDELEKEAQSLGCRDLILDVKDRREELFPSPPVLDAEAAEKAWVDSLFRDLDRYLERHDQRGDD